MIEIMSPSWPIDVSASEAAGVVRLTAVRHPAAVGTPCDREL